MAILNTKPLDKMLVALITLMGSSTFMATHANAEVIVRGEEGAPLAEVRPAPASIYPDEYIIAASPSPSEINPSFLGPVLLLKSGHVNLETGTVELPLRRGEVNGLPAWSVLTDVSDQYLADLHGINFSPKMGYSFTGKATRTATINKDGVFVFAGGTVDFTPEHSVTPGEAPNFFPPAAAQAGAVGDTDYSPMVQVEGMSAIFNMPMVSMASEDELNAMCDGEMDYSKVHDKVVNICPEKGTVTMQLTLGYTFGKPIIYLSTESNDPGIAALEGAIHTPALNDLPFALEDASPGETAERIYAIANGPTGIDNPFRQGVNSALSDAGSHGPLNVLGGINTINLDYSPMWRLFPAKWTDAAIEAGYRTKLTNAFDIENAAEKGLLVSIIDDGPLKPAGIIVNCPTVYRIN
ncbi:DUF7482 domain-containing protein [Halomonas sp. V046]|uniref:DUF7482 domain-containing protein n=1 Tax=Halomonas sp. V046 TaxID=3459611 RepID=UPI004043DB9A